MPQPPAYAEQGKGTKDGCRHGTHSHQAVHIGRALKEIPEAIDIVFAIQIHDGQQQQELGKGKGQGIFRTVKQLLHQIRHRQAQPGCQHLVHGNIHDGKEKQHRPKEPLFHVCHFFFQRRRLFLFGNRLLPLQAGAVTGLFHCGNDYPCVQFPFIIRQLHGVGQQVHAHPLCALQFRHSLFHPCRTG